MLWLSHHGTPRRTLKPAELVQRNMRVFQFNSDSENLLTAQDRSATMRLGVLVFLYSIVKDSLDFRVTGGGGKVSHLSNTLSLVQAARQNHTTGRGNSADLGRKCMVLSGNTVF